MTRFIARWFSTLRARLLLTYLGLIIIGFGGLTWLAGNRISQSIYNDFTSDLRIEATNLASFLAESVEDLEEHSGISSAALGLIHRTSQDTQAQISILDQNGFVWLDSANRLFSASLIEAPEIRNVLSGENDFDVRLNEQGVETIYTAAPILYEDSSRPIGFVRFAAPASAPQAEARKQWLSLGAGFLGFSILGTLICLWLLSTLIRPLRALQNTALHMASGDLTQRVANVTKDEIGEVGNAFNQMAAQVESMVAEQQAFASNASHELRTPLTTIRLRTEALQSGQLDDELTQQYVEEIDGEVQRMSGLVDDLILLSRLDAERLEIGEAQVDLARIVRSVQRELGTMAENKEIELILSKHEALPPVQANVNHVQVVIRNLIENAIKYTPDGGNVTTTLSQIGDVVCLQIEDNGLGIAEEDLPQIVQRFYRADKARSRRTEGVGLGLALVQSVVDLYGGRLQIKSLGIGKGTTVSVLWPC